MQPSNRREKWLWTIRLCVCLPACMSARLGLAVAFLANSHGRKGQPIELKLLGHVWLYEIDNDNIGAR